FIMVMFLLLINISSVYAASASNILLNGKVIAFSGDAGNNLITTKYQSKVYVCAVNRGGKSSCREVRG
ncbi:MAG: hypothetical protein CML28_03135, partial [Rhizobiales bacterium]|nr:hypothetical protein [Hyphomicrobiales bacterium]